MSRPTLTLADRTAWARYERASAAAAEQYHYLPISAGVSRVTHPCLTCRARTYDPVRVCWACRGLGRRAA